MALFEAVNLRQEWPPPSRAATRPVSTFADLLVESRALGRRTRQVCSLT